MLKFKGQSSHLSYKMVLLSGVFLVSIHPTMLHHLIMWMSPLSRVSVNPGLCMNWTMKTDIKCHQSCSWLSPSLASRLLPVDALSPQFLTGQMHVTCLSTELQERLTLLSLAIVPIIYGLLSQLHSVLYTRLTSSLQNWL